MKLSHQQHLLFSSNKFKIPKEIEEIINSYLFIPPVCSHLLNAIRNRKILKDHIQSFKSQYIIPDLTIKHQDLLFEIHQFHYKNRRFNSVRNSFFKYKDTPETSIQTWGINHFSSTTEFIFFSKIYKNNTLPLPDREIWWCLNLSQWQDIPDLVLQIHYPDTLFFDKYLTYCFSKRICWVD